MADDTARGSWFSRARKTLRETILGEDETDRARDTSDGSGGDAQDGSDTSSGDEETSYTAETQEAVEPDSSTEDEGNPTEDDPQWIRHQFVEHVNRAEAEAAAGNDDEAEAAYSAANDYRERYRERTGRTIDDSGETRRDPDDTNYGESDRDVVEQAGEDTEDWTAEQVARRAAEVRAEQTVHNQAWDNENVRKHVEDVLGVDTVTGISDEDAQRVVDANPDHFAADAFKKNDNWEAALDETTTGPNGEEVPIVPPEVADRIRDPGKVIIPDDIKGRIRFVDPNDPRNPDAPGTSDPSELPGGAADGPSVGDKLPGGQELPTVDTTPGPGTDTTSTTPLPDAPPRPTGGDPMNPKAGLPDADSTPKTPEERLYERITEGRSSGGGGASESGGDGSSGGGGASGDSGGGMGGGGWTPPTAGGSAGDAGTSDDDGDNGGGSGTTPGGDEGEERDDDHARYHNETADEFEAEAERQREAGNDEAADEWQKKADEERQKANEEYGEHEEADNTATGGKWWDDDDQNQSSGNDEQDVEYTPSGEGGGAGGPSGRLLEQMGSDYREWMRQANAGSTINPTREGSETPTGKDAGRTLPGVADPPDGESGEPPVIDGPPPTDYNGNAGAIDPSPLDDSAPPSAPGPEDDPLDGVGAPGSGPITVPGASTGQSDASGDTMEPQETLVAEVNYGRDATLDPQPTGTAASATPAPMYALGDPVGSSSNSTTQDEQDEQDEQDAASASTADRTATEEPTDESTSDLQPITNDAPTRRGADDDDGDLEPFE